LVEAGRSVVGELRVGVEVRSQLLSALDTRWHLQLAPFLPFGHPCNTSANPPPSCLLGPEAKTTVSAILYIVIKVKGDVEKRTGRE
jgi:hypothetical protein